MTKKGLIVLLGCLLLLVAGILVLLLQRPAKEAHVGTTATGRSEPPAPGAASTSPQPLVPAAPAAISEPLILLRVVDAATNESVAGATVAEHPSQAALETRAVDDGRQRVIVPWAAPGDACSLVVTARDYVPRVETITIPESGACDLVARLVRCAVIEGIVTAAKSGEPLPDVRAELEGRAAAQSETAGEQEDVQRLVQVSDRQGRFSFRSLPPGYDYTIRFSATGYVPLEKACEAVGPGLREIEVSLASAFDITLHFAWRDGRPVADAAVMLKWQPETNWFSPEGVARTDAQGTVAFQGIVGGKKWADITIDAPGEIFANVFEFVVEEDRSEYSFTCGTSPECLVSVRYGDTGDFAVDCQVRLTLLDALGSTIVRGRTNEEGICRFRGVHPGRAYIVMTAISDKYATLNDWGVTIDGQGITAKEYSLQKRPEKESPSARLQINAASLAAAGEGYDQCSFFVFRDGFLVKDWVAQIGEISETLEVGKLWPGRLRVEAMTSDAWYASETVLVEAKATGTVTLSSVEHRTVSGYIVDADGVLVAGAAVSRTFVRNGILGMPEVSTDGRGFFSLDVPCTDPPGFLRVGYSKPGESNGYLHIVPLAEFKNGSQIVIAGLHL